MCIRDRFLTAESGRVYGEEHLALARELARRVAVGIENARLYYEVRQSVRTRDDFLSAVAHELKTPLTVISGTAQLLRRRMQLSLIHISEPTRLLSISYAV